MAVPCPFNMGNVSSPALSYFAVAPNDNTDILSGFKALYVGVTGSVTIISYSDETVTFAGVVAGTILPVVGRRVMATGTTATSIVGLR